ncbi:MAG: zinc-ribbon domain-containing protein [Bacilli bacterium]|nr:zinc-ribbon domain-containing protein [Bacilli bacterium]
MSLIKCPECRKKISDTVDKCPQCGFDLKDTNKEELKVKTNDFKMDKK